MLILGGVIGAFILFLGRELNFLFAGGMSVLIAFRLVSHLPTRWPNWADYVFIAGLGILAMVLVLINERGGYFMSRTSS